MQLLEAGATGIYHVTGGGPPCTWADVAEFALEAAVEAGITNETAPVNRVTTDEYGATIAQRARRPTYAVLDLSKAASRGVVLRPWQEAVSEYVKALAPATREGGRA